MHFDDGMEIIASSDTLPDDTVRRRLSGPRQGMAAARCRCRSQGGRGGGASARAGAEGALNRVYTW